MNLAIIRRRYNPFGGAERFIERLMPRLAQRDIYTTIIAEDWSGSEAAMPVTQVKSSGWTRTARFHSFQRAVKEVLSSGAGSNTNANKQKVGKIHFDLVQSHERMVGVDIFRLGDGVHAAWVRRLQQESTRLRSLWLNMDSYHRAVIETERAMAQDPKLQYVANSSLVATELTEYWSVPDSRITLIPNGVDTSFYTPATSAQKADARQALAQQYAICITPETLLICIVGSGFARKGVFQLIQACAKLKDCALLICGKDKDISKARTLIGKSNTANRIALTGPLQDVRPLLWASDVFALPSLYDPSSNAVLEALACGLPVVVTKDVGMAWEITDAGAGITCERHVAGLLQSIRKCQDVSHRQNMAFRARAFALRYEQNLVIEQWLGFYRKMRARQ